MAHFPHFTDDAYSKLLLDVFHGKRESFVRDDELERSWELFQPILESEGVELERYVQGSSGPPGRREFWDRVGVEDSTEEMMNVRGTHINEDGTDFLRSSL